MQRQPLSRTPQTSPSPVGSERCCWWLWMSLNALSCGAVPAVSAVPSHDFTEEKSCSHKREPPSCRFGSDMVVIDGCSGHEAVLGLLCTCGKHLYPACSPRGLVWEPWWPNTLPAVSEALKSVLRKGSLPPLGICLSHQTLLHPAGRKPGDGHGRDSEVPVSHCWAADYHINVQCPNWVLGKGQYISNWKYKGLLMAQLELGGFMSLPLDGIEGNGMIHWAVCMSPDLLPIIYIPLKSISAEGHSQPEIFHVKSFLSQTYSKARKDCWQLKLVLRLLILILWLGERRL